MLISGYWVATRVYQPSFSRTNLLPDLRYASDHCLVGNRCPSCWFPGYRGCWRTCHQVSRSIMFPSMQQIWPTSLAVRQPQTITFPPLCFTTFFVNCSSKASPGFLQHHERPSEPIKLNFDSSENMTLFQLSTVQSVWALAHASLFCLCAFVNRGILWHI